MIRSIILYNLFFSYCFSKDFFSFEYYKLELKTESESHFLYSLVVCGCGWRRSINLKMLIETDTFEIIILY